MTQEITIIPVVCEYNDKLVQTFGCFGTFEGMKLTFRGGDIFNNVNAGQHGYLKQFSDKDTKSTFFVYKPSTARHQARLTDTHNPA